MTVEWFNSARDHLADYWVQATPAERDAIEAAVLWTEAALQLDPHNLGESRSNHLRVVHTPPLSFWFRVVPGGGKVTIVRVIWARRRK